MKRKPELYDKKTKNVVGVDIKFNEPLKPDYIIDNCLTLEKLSKEANLILRKLKIFDHNYFNNFVVISLELLIFIWIKKVEKSKWILLKKLGKQV